MKKSRHYPYRPYFTDVRTGKSQFGKSTFKNGKIPLPTDWVRLNTEYSPYYKYIGDQIDDSSLYAPKLDKTIEKATFMELKNLNNEDAKTEIRRRKNLFESIAELLNMDSSDIRDESIEYLVASKNGNGVIILVDQIISHIQRKESTVYDQTIFKKFQEEDPSYTSERSLRELIGMNSFFKDDDIMSQMKNFFCPLSLHMLVDPVILTSGITYERDFIKPHLFGSKTSKCPVTKTTVDLAVFIPNLILRATIENFYQKHKDQRGGFWTSLKQEFHDYAASAINRPMNVELTEGELKYAELRRLRPYDFLD